MPTPPFSYQDPFPLGEDQTEYRLLSQEGVSLSSFEGTPVLKVAPADMWQESNTGTNLPAQIDVLATTGKKYEFLFVAKGGGSANKMFLFQETKALLNPKSFEKFVADKLQYLGTAACPPYHLVFVVGGTSAEACMKTLKLASTKSLDA